MLLIIYLITPNLSTAGRKKETLGGKEVTNGGLFQQYYRGLNKKIMFFNLIAWIIYGSEVFHLAWIIVILIFI